MNELLNNVQMWLDAQDGPRVAAAVLGAFILLCVVCAFVGFLSTVETGSDQ